MQSHINTQPANKINRITVVNSFVALDKICYAHTQM